MRHFACKEIWYQTKKYSVQPGVWYGTAEAHLIQLLRKNVASIQLEVTSQKNQRLSLQYWNNKVWYSYSNGDLN